MKRKCTLYRIMIICLVLSLFEPRGVAELAIYWGGIWDWLDLLFKIWKYISFPALAIFYVLNIKKISQLLVLLIVQEIIIIFSSVKNGNMDASVLLNAITFIVAVSLVDFCVKKNEIIFFLQTLVNVLGAFIIVNFVSILLFPKGIYVDHRGWENNYFFGYKNSHIYVYIVYFVAMEILHYLQSRPLGIKGYGMFALALISSFLCDSSTSLVAFSITTILVIFFHKIRIPKIVSLSKIYFSSMLMSILIVLFQVQTVFSNFIENVLNRTITFTGRTKIWTVALSYIVRRPIIGNGSILFEHLFKTWTVTQGHNYFLDLVLVGGVTLLIINAAIFISVSKRVSMIRETSLYTMLIFILTAYGILFLMEASRGNVYMYIVLALCFNIPKIINQYEVSENSGRLPNHVRFSIRIKI